MKVQALQKRGCMSVYIVMIMTIAALVWLSNREGDDKFWQNSIRNKVKGNQLTYVMTFVAVGLMDFLIGELLRRVCLFCEELKQSSRYDGKALNMLQASFLSHGSKQFIVIPVLLSVLSFLSLNGADFCLVLTIINNTWNYALILAITLLPYLLGLREPTRAEVSDYLEKHRLNVGHGLAWSYYFGYLRLILPSLKKRLQKWQSKQLPNSRMTHKLYILVPKSCYCYPTLKDADDAVSVCLDGPDSVYASRAGSVARNYKNTVYRFHGIKEKDIYYCCAEYATPILSLYEMSDNEEAGLSHDDRLEQMKQFCATLNEILSKVPEFRENCRVLLFDDVDDNGEDRKISSILMEEIERDLTSSVTSGRI